MPERARASSGLRCARSSSDFCVICGAAVTPGCNRRASSAFRRSCATAAPIRPLVCGLRRGLAIRLHSARHTGRAQPRPNATRHAARHARERGTTHHLRRRAPRGRRRLVPAMPACMRPAGPARRPRAAAARRCRGRPPPAAAAPAAARRAARTQTGERDPATRRPPCTGCRLRARRFRACGLGRQGVGPPRVQGFRGRTCSRIEPSESAGLNVHCRSSSSCQRALLQRVATCCNTLQPALLLLLPACAVATRCNMLQRVATCSAPRALSTACAVRPARVCARTCAQEPEQARAPTRTSARFLVSSWWRRFRSAHAAMCAELRPAPPNSAALPAEICGVPCRRIHPHVRECARACVCVRACACLCVLAADRAARAVPSLCAPRALQPRRASAHATLPLAISLSCI